VGWYWLEYEKIETDSERRHVTNIAKRPEGLCRWSLLNIGK
jgi:hypothetical protein